MIEIEQSPAAFSELHGVVAVAAHRSFRRAATALGISASALSHAVAGLERRLGVRLFHRTTRSVALSEAGARFVERIRPALRDIAAAIDTVNDFRDTPTGTLRINTARSAAAWILEPIILPFLARYPDMRIDLVTDDRLVDIVAGGFDAGIRLAETVPRDMIAVPCSPPLRFVVVATPGYLARRGRPRSPADLHAHTCIRRRMASGALAPWEFERGGEAITVDVDGALTLDTSELMVAATLRGAGLAWVNAWTVERLLAQRRLVSVLDDWSPPFPGLCLYYPARAPSAGLRAFVATIRESKLAAGTPRAGRRGRSPR
jgi:DNA-binding transcriptional LysR family regulator